MLVFHFDPETGVLVGSSEAMESPLEKDKLLIPANATEIVPPEPIEGTVSVFRNGAWQQEHVPVPEPTPDPVPTEASYSNAIQAMMDAKAREHQYDGIQSAVTYRGDPNTKFAAEAEALFTWRSTVWTYATAQLAAAMAGSRSQPTVVDFVGEVQAKCPFSWPS